MTEAAHDPDEPLCDVGPDERGGAGEITPAGRWRRAIGFVIGAGLFIAAVWAIVTGGTDFRSAFDAARAAPWWLVAGVLLLPMLNWLAVSASFHVLNNRYGRVGRVEMGALIASAWLLNYLPFKPGMFGRLAYHKKINGIRFSDSARVLLINAVLTVFSMGVLVSFAVAVRLFGIKWGWEWGWVWSLPVLVALSAAALVLRWRAPGDGVWAWRVAAAAALRYFDIMTWVGRYAASFALIGHPLSLDSAVLVTAVSQFVLLIPLAGNGLGLREWGVRAATEPVGLLADVVNRAAEIAVSLPLGIAGSVFAGRRLIRHGRPPETAGAVESVGQKD